MARAKKSATRAKRRPIPLRRDERLAFDWALAGARRTIRHITSSPQWLKAPLQQHVDFVLDEIEELHLDTESAFLALDALDRLVAKTVMLREAVRRLS